MRNIYFLTPTVFLIAIMLWSINNPQELPSKNELIESTGIIKSYECKKGKIREITFTNPNSTFYTYIRNNLLCSDDIRNKKAQFLVGASSTYMYQLVIEDNEIYSYEQSLKSNQSRSKGLLAFYIAPLFFLIIFWLKPFLTKNITRR